MQRHFLTAGYFTLLLILFSGPIPARSQSLTSDTTWQGNVTVEDDLVIPAGITLTIKPGTQITVLPSDNTKTDPEYMSPLTEIVVRGILKIEGLKESQVAFSLKQEPGVNKDRWAGIVINGGQVIANHLKIADAENAFNVLGGSLIGDNCIITNNRYGLVAQGRDSLVTLSNSQISANDYGVLALRGANISRKKVTIEANTKKDLLSLGTTTPAVITKHTPKEQEARRSYGDEVLLGDTVWQGRIQVTGLIRLPVGSRLIVLPGSVIEFSKNDTNNDGIGENGLMIQGVLIAKGTLKNPIIFRSSEKNRKPGDWDAINIINSDGARNLIEYCQIEDAYRGLHFHFANVAVYYTLFTNNFRGIQFQESAVDIRNNIFFNNNSGIQARDSEIEFHNNTLTDNIAGANFFRTSISASGNTISRNFEFGMKIREGFPKVSNNALYNNRYGLMLQDTKFGEVSANLLANNIESGLSLNTVDNTAVHSNYIQANGFNGINIRETRATISDNHITDNGERGIGILAFYGMITRNTFCNNGRYHIENEGKLDVAAPLNWFAESDPAPMIFDKVDDAGRGLVDYMPVLTRPDAFQWSLPTIPTNLIWREKIDIPFDITVPMTVTLSIAHGARIAFAENAGLVVQGKLLASGDSGKRILFTSLNRKQKNSWDEIRLEHAEGSIFTNCDFEFATWALHCHFTYLPVTGCRFKDNYGGIRFRSGPLMIHDSLFTGNTIGIRSFIGKAVIENNVITKNEKGIFVREMGSGLFITKNNIYANEDYNIRLGEFNNEDVNAPENWWGTVTPLDTFFDAHIEPGIGFVRYEPVLQKPLPVKAEDFPDEQQPAVKQ